MKLLSWVYYLLDRRIGKKGRFNNLYLLDPDPFGCETYTYERQKANDLIGALHGQRFVNILDLGCGTGVLTKELSHLSKTVTAIDFSERAIDIALRKCQASNIKFQCNDIRNLALQERYDLIVCSEVLYYLNSQELVQFLKKIRNSQEDGTILVTVGKVFDQTVKPLIESIFTLQHRIEKNKNRRPYAINIYRMTQ